MAIAEHRPKVHATPEIPGRLSVLPLSNRTILLAFTLIGYNAGGCRAVNFARLSNPRNAIKAVLQNGTNKCSNVIPKKRAG